MSTHKCPRCGLVNFSTAVECKRCGVAIGSDEVFDAEVGGDGEEERPRSLAKRALAVAGMTGFIIFAWYISLLETSDPLTYDQKQVVHQAIGVLDRKGFGREAFILRRLVNYRTTDNWWNRWIGHGDAYAATNFPFEVVTLYPDFFKLPADDLERAVILLHEARHLMGDDEEEAFTAVWQSKGRLGWTNEGYGETRVWKNVTEYTARYAPQLFRCGPKGESDCTE